MYTRTHTIRPEYTRIVYSLTQAHAPPRGQKDTPVRACELACVRASLRACVRARMQAHRTLCAIVRISSHEEELRHRAAGVPTRHPRGHGRARSAHAPPKAAELAVRPAGPAPLRPRMQPDHRFCDGLLTSALLESPTRKCNSSFDSAAQPRRVPGGPRPVGCIRKSEAITVTRQLGLPPRYRHP